MLKIGFFNNKGGVAKSTSSASVAAYFSKRNKKDKGQTKKTRKKVLLVDTDPQGNSTKNFVNRKEYPKVKSLRDIFLAFENNGRKPVDLEPYIIHVNEYLDIIPANSDLELSNRELLGKYEADKYLSKVLSWVETEYDICVIDTPPNLSMLTTNALIACDEIYIPIRLGGYELDGLKTLLLGVRDVEALDKIKGIFVTQYEKQLSLNEEVVEVINKILNVFGLTNKLMETKIRKNTALNEANSKSINIYDYKPGSSGAVDYSSLSEEILVNGDRK